MIFHRNRAEYTDGLIDLVPIHFTPPDPSMGFGREQIWKITKHNSRGEIGQISYRDGESRCIYYFGHIGYHIDPPYRGNHYARRACLLLKGEILRSGQRAQQKDLRRPGLPLGRHYSRSGRDSGQI